MAVTLGPANKYSFQESWVDFLNDRYWIFIKCEYPNTDTGFDDDVNDNIDVYDVKQWLWHQWQFCIHMIMIWIDAQTWHWVYILLL